MVAARRIFDFDDAGGFRWRRALVSVTLCAHLERRGTKTRDGHSVSYSETATSQLLRALWKELAFVFVVQNLIYVNDAAEQGQYEDFHDHR